MFKRTKPNTTGQQPVYLSLDIGTEFIKTALFRINEKQEIEIIGYDRAPQKLNAMRGALIINLQNVIDVVDVSIGTVIHMAEKITGSSVSLPQKVIMGIAGELVQGLVIEVSVEREDADAKVTQSEIDQIIKQIRQQAFSGAIEDISRDTGIKPDQIREIDTVINSVYVDGVKVDSPLGFKGSDLIYKVFSTFAPRIHVESIKEVASALSLDTWGIIVEPYALALGVENARDERFSGVFIDIGGGTTDIALVENGAVIDTKMFAIGGRVFTKRLEQEFNIDTISAEKMKIEYTDQKLSSADSKNVKQAISKDLPVWLEGVELALSEFHDIAEFPSQFYLCGGGSLLPDIQSALIAHPWLQVLPFGKFPKFNFLFPNQIENVVDLTRTVTNLIDVTPMALARMALDTR